MHENPIGILDSGVGGITVRAEIVRLLPGESTIYLADTANCPYGGRSHAEILDLTRECVKSLLEHDVKMIVLACNTMTGAAIAQLRVEYPKMPFIGLEPAIKPAASATRSGTIGILATQATLSSRLYKDTLERYAGDVKVIQVAGDGLVELAEAGEEESPRAVELLEKYLRPMLDAGADTLVLGCTHYPFFRRAIDKISGGRLNIMDSAGAVARRVKQVLAQKNIFAPESHTPSHIFKSTGPDNERKLKERAKSYTFTP